MHRATVQARHNMALAARAPQADGDQLTRTSSTTTRRKASSTKSRNEDTIDLLATSTSMTTRRKAKAKSTSTVPTPPSGTTLPNFSSGVVQTYDNSAYITGSGASIALAAAAASASPSGSPSSSASGLPKPALYAILIGGAVVALAAIAFLAIFCYKRRQERQKEAEWSGFSPDAAFRGSMAPGPGKGVGARGQRLADEDEISFGGMEKNAYPMDVPSPVREKQNYDFDGSNFANPTTPRLAYNNGFQSEAPLTPSHPDYIPARPPRPSEQYSFTSSPIKTVQHQAPVNSNSNTMNTYQRNLLALTSSMSFDNPMARAQAVQGVQPDSSPFADTSAVPVTRKASKKVNNPKKDTIIGFAESYADDEEDSTEREGSASTRPLNFRSTGPPGSRETLALPKTPDIAPTLSTVDLPNTASSSMRDLENALDSFGYDSTAPSESAATSALKTGYRITRPGAAVGISLVSNVNSIYSTAGDIGEISPTQAKFPSSATSPNLAAVSAGTDATRAGLPRSTTSPALASKRRSMSAGTGMVTSRSQPSVPALVRTDSRNSTGEVLIPWDSTKRLSIMTFETSAEDEKLSPFGLEEDAKLARALSLSRKAKANKAESIRQRSNSVSQKHSQPTRQPRSRTSTAYGGQMPPTPAMQGSGRSRTMTTESEAVFAVGSNMLSASPDEPFMPYLRSPDFLVQPPSPSQGSDVTSFSALDKEREYHRQLAENGFVPLSQMALSVNDRDRHYRSPIDSIVGVFEYDDPGHSTALTGRSA